MIEEILERFNLKFEDLKPVERETLYTWVAALEESVLTVDKVKEHISAMRVGVEQELTKVGHESKQDIFLKARLRNYILLEAFLTSPEKAKEQMEKALAGIAGKE